MTATQLPPAAKATMDSVREGLADIRDRLSDIESLPDWDSITEQASHLVDRATGRRRRSRWPFVALGVLAVVGLAVGVAMFVMTRNGMQDLDELENEEDRVWSPGQVGSSPTSHTAGTFEKRTSATTGTTDSFPASDPMSSPMTPGIGGS